jgi:hypothetical protein
VGIGPGFSGVQDRIQFAANLDVKVCRRSNPCFSDDPVFALALTQLRASSVFLSMLPLPPGGGAPGPAAAPLRPLLDRGSVAAHDGPGQRGFVVLTLAFAPVKRTIPGVRLGPAEEAAFRPHRAAREPREQPLSVHAHKYIIRSLRVKGLMGDRDKTGEPSKCIRAHGRRMARRYPDHPPHPHHVRLGGGTLLSAGGQPRRREPSAETSEMTSTHSRGPRQRAREI